MRLDDDKLQQYFDGELPENEAAAVKRIVTASTEELARIESLRTLRSLLQLTAEDLRKDVADGDSDALFAKIRGEVAREKALGLKVLEGERVARSRSNRWVLLAVAAAAAGVLAVMLRPGTGPTAPRAPVAQGGPASPAGGGQGHAATPTPPTGTEVVSVDFGTRTGTVFALEGEAGEPIAVVWIDEEEGTL